MTNLTSVNNSSTFLRSLICFWTMRMNLYHFARVHYRYIILPCILSCNHDGQVAEKTIYPRYMYHFEKSVELGYPQSSQTSQLHLFCDVLPNFGEWVQAKKRAPIGSILISSFTILLIRTHREKGFFSKWKPPSI